MAIKRQSPYVRVTWLSKLLVGENCCEWGAWFKTQHEGSSWSKVPGTFDQTTWQLEHTSLLREVRAKLEAEGKTVFTENQNNFSLRGTTAALGGKPDLIATSGRTGIILDAKTGNPSPAHHVQVMLYMYAVPRALGQYRGVTFDGRVVYKDHEVEIPSRAIDEKFIGNLADLIRRLGSTTCAKKVPNPVECGFCEITEADCPERAVASAMQQGETKDF